MKTLVLAALTLVGATAAQAKEQVADFGDNAGDLLMFQHVPGSAPAGAPLVVLLHGCGQSTDDFDGPSGWLTLSEVAGFALLMPEQQASNNPQRCFNWFAPADFTRGGGEVASIVAMVEHMRDNAGIDDTRVFVVGLSAGAAMGAALLTQYPDVFAAGGLFAGVAVGCATNAVEGLGCMQSPPDHTPEEWAALVPGADAPAGPWPRVMVWHGNADATVSVDNGVALMRQLVGLHGFDLDLGSFQTNALRTTLRWPSGEDTVVFHEVDGMGHAVPIDSGRAAQGCGEAALFMADGVGCSTRELADFFGILFPDGEGPIGDDDVFFEGDDGVYCGCLAAPQQGAGGGAAALFALAALAARRSRRRHTR
jgi:poly(hydroxyalkanoate) depolymerase family esterase